MIELKTGEIAQIKDICLLNDGTFWFQIEKFIAEQIAIGTEKISHIWEIKSVADYATVPISDVRSKMVKLDLSEKRKYICNIPNLIELQ